MNTASVSRTYIEEARKRFVHHIWGILFSRVNIVQLLPRKNISDIISEVEAAYKFPAHTYIYVHICIRLHMYLYTRTDHLLSGLNVGGCPDPRVRDENSPFSDMKALKKARDNGVTLRLLMQLNHPVAEGGTGARSEERCRKIIPKFSNYDVRARYRRDIRAKTARRVAAYDAYDAPFDIALRAHERVLGGCNPLRMDKNERCSARF